jgi:hypothetical protein
MKPPSRRPRCTSKYYLGARRRPSRTRLARTIRKRFTPYRGDQGVSVVVERTPLRLTLAALTLALAEMKPPSTAPSLYLQVLSGRWLRAFAHSARSHDQKTVYALAQRAGQRVVATHEPTGAHMMMLSGG